MVDAEKFAFAVFGVFCCFTRLSYMGQGQGTTAAASSTAFLIAWRSSAFSAIFGRAAGAASLPAVAGRPFGADGSSPTTVRP
jgi:hypothetical protein